ncbi:hypothetical protein [Thermosporothrix hazakensis]|uniref:hypothetical protein n=1 Tax=Thermosporothrix hazakensis TaxID=644383 RepID=UPI000DAEB2A6|nr:hypothetical protein [Thermosporothrix hazakensis]GCE49542.1 hypothetical protein KTH_44110 [Thermosporothrix hazakensis]
MREYASPQGIRLARPTARDDGAEKGLDKDVSMWHTNDASNAGSLLKVPVAAKQEAHAALAPR